MKFGKVSSKLSSGKIDGTADKCKRTREKVRIQSGEITYSTDICDFITWDSFESVPDLDPLVMRKAVAKEAFYPVWHMEALRESFVL